MKRQPFLQAIREEAGYLAELRRDLRLLRHALAEHIATPAEDAHTTRPAIENVGTVYVVVHYCDEPNCRGYERVIDSVHLTKQSAESCIEDGFITHNRNYGHSYTIVPKTVIER